MNLPHLLSSLRTRWHLPSRPEPASWLRHAAPLAASMLVTCGLVAAMQLPLIMADYRVTALFALALFCSGVTIAAAWLVGFPWRGLLPLTVLVLGGFGFLLTVSAVVARYGLILLIVGLIFYSLSSMERQGDKDDVGERLTVLLLAPASFFSYAFCYAVLEYTSVSAPVMALLAGVLSGAVAADTVWRVRPIGAFPWRVPACAAVLATELFLALSFLPLKHLVNGAVLAILLSLCVHKTRDVLVPFSNQLTFRRHAALSILLIAGILMTAQWL